MAKDNTRQYCKGQTSVAAEGLCIVSSGRSCSAALKIIIFVFWCVEADIVAARRPAVGAGYLSLPVVPSSFPAVYFCAILFLLPRARYSELGIFAGGVEWHGPYHFVVRVEMSRTVLLVLIPRAWQLLWCSASFILFFLWENCWEGVHTGEPDLLGVFD